MLCVVLISVGYSMVSCGSHLFFFFWCRSCALIYLAYVASGKKELGDIGGTKRYRKIELHKLHKRCRSMQNRMEG